MMRVHLAYRSLHRAREVARQKLAFLHAVPNLHNKYHVQAIWDLVYPHKKVGQGYEYVSRLIRFGPSNRRKSGRLTPWQFYGLYDKLDVSMDLPELMLIQFMTKYARRDRSVNKIRIVCKNDLELI